MVCLKFSTMGLVSFESICLNENLYEKLKVSIHSKTKEKT